MQFSVTFRHMDPSDSLKQYGRDKLNRLEKLLDSVLSADVTFTVDKFRHKTEVVLTSDGLKIKALEESDDCYAALDLVVDKLEKQLKRHVEKQRGRKTAPRKAAGGNGQAAGDDDDDYDSEAGVVAADRTSDLTLSRMALAEAAEVLAHSKNTFVVFVDSEDGGLRLLHQSGGGALELLRLHS
ncbi:MAG: ribosome-associated translation inhibitor RaiA [Deltaproteobacteria bacterium]|nr:ribosome-associated translation inhibitor RaiA [Deltaproteobacteria bacterium]